MPDINTLLPSGFRDVLPPEAAAETDVVARLLAHFESFGYQRVKPPLLEFEESLLSGAGASLPAHTFRVMDPLSRRMMGVRADMTPQIARIASARLAYKPRPLRLSYSGQVIRVQGEGLHADRQLAQAGIELIGDDSAASDTEAVYVAFTALRALGMDISVDFHLPRLAAQIMDRHGVPGAERAAMLSHVQRKDAVALRAMRHKGAEALAALLPLSSGPAGILDNIQEGGILPPEAGKDAGRLRAVIAGLEAQHPGMVITLDLLDCRSAGYHTGAGFSFFSPSSRDELGRGGRYLLESGGANAAEHGVGFTLSVTAIKRALGRGKKRRRIYVPHGVPYGETEKIRAKYTAVHGLAPAIDVESEAARLGCGYVWRHGKMEPVSS